MVILAYGIGFLFSFIFYAYMIHKKEKKFVLGTYAKWSIISTNTIVFSQPLIIVLDHIKNNYTPNVNFNFKDLFYYQLILCTIIYFNNLIIQFIYQTKFVKKLSDKTKSVGNRARPSNAQSPDWRSTSGSSSGRGP